MNFSKATAILLFGFILPSAWGQEKPATLDANDPASKYEDKRVAGVLPNYRTAEMTADYHPISAKYKITIALKDTFDTPLLFIGAIYSSFYQLENDHPQFGQGTVGYLRRFGASYNDQVMGNMMTEGVLPIAFREDPRYFRMAKGSVPKRTFYALSRLFITKTDAGHASFNFAEVVGNSAASAVGLTYYSDDRSFGSYSENVGIQLMTDGISQVLKEFWPDIKRHYTSKHHKAVTQ